MNPSPTTLILTFLLGVIGIAAACTLAALHLISGGEAMTVVTLVLGGGVTVAGVHVGAIVSSGNGPVPSGTVAPAPPAPTPSRQQLPSAS